MSTPSCRKYLFLGYIGKNCNKEDPCLPDKENQTMHDCLHGKCVHPSVVLDGGGQEVVHYECECFTGYTGAQCSEIIGQKR